MTCTRFYLCFSWWTFIGIQFLHFFFNWFMDFELSPIIHAFSFHRVCLINEYWYFLFLNFATISYLHFISKFRCLSCGSENSSLLSYFLNTDLFFIWVTMNEILPNLFLYLVLRNYAHFLLSTSIPLKSEFCSFERSTTKSLLIPRLKRK